MRRKASDLPFYLVSDAFSHSSKPFGQGKSIGIFIFSCFRCLFSLDQAFGLGKSIGFVKFSCFRCLFSLDQAFRVGKRHRKVQKSHSKTRFGVLLWLSGF
jgi:hypothetical protein